MRVLTWLPRDLRARLEDVDPARDAPVPALPPTERLLARRGAMDEAPATTPVRRPRHRLRRWAAPAAAAATVAAVVVVLVTVGRSAPSHPAAAPSPASSSSTSTSTNTGATDAAARMWAGFPVRANPRPIVLVGPQTGDPVEGFPKSDDKLAYLEGRLNWPASVKESVAAGAGTPMDGTALIPARQALTLLPHATAGPPTPVTLEITSVTLVRAAFETDRGTQQLPAWEFGFAGVSSPAFVLAVGPAGRYPAQLADGSGVQAPAVLGADGRTLTVRFVAHQDPGPCQDGFDQVLDVAQTPTAVVLAVTVTNRVQATSGVLCGAVRIEQTGPITPGAPGTRTITLDQPVGARVVVDGTGKPYRVTG